MNCLKCQTETSGDYPACSKCAPLMHFSHRTDCRCENVDCTAIAAARQAVANGEATERTKSDLQTYDQHNRIICDAQAKGLTVHSNIHTYRASALADLRRVFAQNAPATARSEWRNGNVEYAAVVELPPPPTKSFKMPKRVKVNRRDMAILCGICLD